MRLGCLLTRKITLNQVTIPQYISYKNVKLFSESSVYTK